MLNRDRGQHTLLNVYYEIKLCDSSPTMYIHMNMQHCNLGTGLSKISGWAPKVSHFLYTV